MKSLRVPALVGAAVWAAVATSVLAPTHAAPTQRRFALVVGNDSGGPDTKPLLYAADDARKVHRVLTELGGVPSADALLLVNRSAGELMGALGQMEARIAEAKKRGERSLLLFYYSGHAKDGDLRLGTGRVRIADVKSRLQSGGADIRVGIFDSCRSGLVTRTKGARKGPAFEIEATGSEETRGFVLLSSSSADEDAQESDEIAASYFSHYLVAGLRGDADRTRDGRVTLSEAYEYAYARTVADTAASTAGAQHPTFSYDLKGNADVVLTNLRNSREGLYLPVSAPAGTYYIVDRDGRIAAEIVKPANTDRHIALASDRYKVKRRLPDRLRVGEVQIPRGQLAMLDENRLRDVPFSDDPVKGGRREPESRLSIGFGTTVQAFFDEPTREGLFPPAGMLTAELFVHDFFRRGWVWGLDLAAGGANGRLVVRDATGMPFKFTELSIGTSLVAEWPLADRRLFPFAGLRLAALFMGREFEGTPIPKQSFATFSPGVVGGLRYRVLGGFSALARTRVHYLLYNVDENRSLGYWELAAGLTYDF